MPTATEQRLRDLMHRRDLTVEELAEETSRWLPSVAPRQTRYKVRARPDVRTIRYYVSQKLLPKPYAYEGGRARYGGTHVLRLLKIKQLQAEHLPLKRIKQSLSEQTDDALLASLAPPDEPMSTSAFASPSGRTRRSVSGDQVPELALLGEAHAGETTPPRPTTRTKRGRLQLDRAQPATVEAGRSLTLNPGGTLDVPQDILRDSDKRRALADNLEALAAWLRDSAPTNDDDEEK